MAQAPQIGAGNIVPITTNPGGGYLKVTTPTAKPEMFGSLEGAAVTKFGEGIESTGKMLGTQAEATQGLINEATARDGVTDAMTQMGKAAAEYQNERGKNAVDGFASYQEKLKSIAAAAYGKTENPAVRRMMQNALTAHSISLTNQGLSHRGQQLNEWQITSSQTAAKSFAGQAMNADSVQDQKKQIDAGSAEIRHVGEVYGWDEQTIQSKIKSYQGDAYRDIITKTALTDPLKAQNVFEQTKHLMDPQDQLRTQEFLKSRVDKAGDDAFYGGVLHNGAIAPGSTSADVLFDRGVVFGGEKSNGQQNGADGKVLTSPKGALGVSQILPGTAQEVAKRAGLPWDPERLKTDQAYNYALGKTYFNMMLEKYQNPTLAFAAYNAGPGNVDGWLQDIGDPRKGNISFQDWIDKLPSAFKETKDYIIRANASVVGASGYQPGEAQPGNPNVPKMTREQAIGTAQASSGDPVVQVRRMAFVNHYYDLVDHNDAQFKADVDRKVQDMAPAALAGETITIPEADIRRAYHKDPETGEQIIANLKLDQAAGQQILSAKYATPEQRAKIRQDLIDGTIGGATVKGKRGQLLPSGEIVPTQAEGSHFEDAKNDLKLTPQEEYLYQHHLDNLGGSGKVRREGGAISTISQVSFEQDGKTYNVPTIWNGKELSPREAINKAREVGLDKFPSYANENAAEARYSKMHDYMERDTADFIKSEKPGGQGADFRTRNLVFQRYMQLEQSQQAALKEDPAAYVMGMPGMAPAYTAAHAQDAPPQAFQEWAAKVTAAQLRLGVAPSDVRILPKQEAVQLANAFAHTDPATQDLGPQMTQMQERYGQFWPQVYKQMVQQGGLPKTAQSVAWLNEPGQENVRQEFTRATQFMGTEGTDKLYKNVPHLEGNVIRDGMEEALRPVLRTILTPGRSGQGADAADNLRQTVAAVALWRLWQSGGSGKDALDSAVKDIVSQKWDLAGQTYRTPKGLYDKTATATANALNSLKPEQIQREGGNANLTDKQWQDIVSRSDFVWVNNDDGSGVYLVQHRASDGAFAPVHMAAGPKDSQGRGPRMELKFDQIRSSTVPLRTPSIYHRSFIQGYSGDYTMLPGGRMFDVQPRLQVNVGNEKSDVQPEPPKDLETEFKKTVARTQNADEDAAAIQAGIDSRRGRKR